MIGGLAVDIGTTTVSALIVDMLETEKSWQKPLPETDRSVLVRMLSTVSLNPRNLEDRKTAECNDQRNLKPDDFQHVPKHSFPGADLPDAAACRNTTMEHLMMGINADPLRMEPYIPAFFKTNSLFASDVGILRSIRTHILLWHRTSEAM